MRARRRGARAAVACALGALAAVFSVQQGEHGPLVVYKLQVRPQAAPTVPVPLTPAPVEAATPALPAGGGVTLQQVSDELTWRRDTAGKLPQTPFAPRF